MNLGIYLKRNLFGLMFLQKQKLKLPRQLHLVQYWTVFFTGLKWIRILGIFLNCCGKGEQQWSVCTGYNIKASFTVEPMEMLCVVFSESLEVLHVSQEQGGLWGTRGHITQHPSETSTAFSTLYHHFQCAIFTYFYTPNEFLVSKS